MPTKSRTALIAEIWKFVQKEETTIPEDLRTTKKEIEEAVFRAEERDSPGEAEIRISGETGNTFSEIYVNYYDGEETAAELLHYLGEHGFESVWFNPGYMVVGGK